MLEELRYKEITLEDLPELAQLYIETFNSEPWNDMWTIDTATKRLKQMINTEDSYGLCVYQGEILCGAVLGCMEQFYDGIMFNLKEFWVKNGMRGCGIGTKIFAEMEKRLKEKQIKNIILFTSKGDFTEYFYHKQDMKTNPEMVFMSKSI